MSEDTNIIEDALAEGTFDVLSAARGNAYPTDNILIFTDQALAYEIRKVEAQINGENDGELVNQLDEYKQSLIEDLKETSLRFYLRGHAPGVTKKLKREADKQFGKDFALKDGYTLEDKNLWLNYSYLAEDIVQIENAQGQFDQTPKTYDDIVELAAWIPGPEFDKVFNLMFELTFASSVFDEAVGPDFSRKR